MDFVHHTLIGAAGAVYGLSVGEPLAGAAFMIGSVAPDFDIAMAARGKRRYLKAHQGATHSIFVMPFMALAVELALNVAAGEPLSALSWKVCGAALAGMLLHCLLDLSNCFGVRLLWPLPKRYCMDAMFFVDAPTLALTATALWALLTRQAEAGTIVALYALCFGSYALFRWGAQGLVRSRLEADTVIPAPINPFGAYYTRTTGGIIECGTVNTITGRAKAKKNIPVPTEDAIEAASKSETFQDLSSVMRRLTPISVERDNAGEIRRIVAANIALPSYGTRIGQVELEFDRGNLVSERARI